MAIGLMRMFGFRILENFNYPYVARSVREFWRRWHISLSNWFRDYLYVPLGGNRRGARRAYANLVVVFLLCGLWHGASWPFVLWGAWHGLFLVAERAGLDRLLARAGPLAHLYALAAVMGGWVLFRCDTLTHALDYYAALAGAGGADPSRHPLAQHLDALTAATLAAAVVFATPLARDIGRWRDRVAVLPVRAVLVHGADLGWLAGVLLASAAMLAAGTYNPFIYFRF
jgi:alginate O-acetyltransferase complex protein AlgI